MKQQYIIFTIPIINPYKSSVHIELFFGQQKTMKYSGNAKGEYNCYYKAVIKWNTSTLLTVHHQHNPFTDRWRYPV